MAQDPQGTNQAFMKRRGLQQPQAPVTDPSQVAADPTSMPTSVAGPAPGSSLYASNPSVGAPPVQAPKPQGFQDVTGIDPTAPIRAMQAAHSEQQAAQAQMTQAQNTPISPVRGILGTLAGAAAGYAAPKHPELGAQLGSNIINAPKNKAIGLAASRAASANQNFESSEKIGGAVDKAQGRFTDVQAEKRLQTGQEHTISEDAADNDRAEREVGAPVHVGDNMVVSPQHAPKGGGPIQTTNIGAAPVTSATKTAHYETDATGLVHQTVLDEKTGQSTTMILKDTNGSEIKMSPKDVTDMQRAQELFIKANPLANDKQIYQAALDWRKAGSIGLQAQEAAHAYDEGAATKTSELTGEISNTPEVKAALASGDPNAYNAAVEHYLSLTTSPEYVKIIKDARAELAKGRPTRPPAKTGNTALDVLQAQRNAQQQQPKP